MTTTETLISQKCVLCSNYYLLPEKVRNYICPYCDYEDAKYVFDKRKDINPANTIAEPKRPTSKDLMIPVIPTKKPKRNPRQHQKHNCQVKLSAIIHRKFPDDHYIPLIGCTAGFFISYIEAKFTPGMSWDNYGLNTWNIDHYIPYAFFDFNDPVERRICWNYRNLQPLWHKHNMIKKDKLPSDYLTVHNDICEALDYPLWKLPK